MGHTKPRIVIAGGGFAGLYAAMHLDKTVARRGEAEVVLISRENFILFTPMLHEVAAGDLHPGDIVNRLARLRNRPRTHGDAGRVSPALASAGSHDVYQ